MNSYISIVPETLEIVDRYRGSESDVAQRSQKLEHIIVPEHLDSKFVIISRNPDTNEIEFQLDEEALNKHNLNVMESKWILFRNERNRYIKESNWIVSVSNSPLSQEKIEEWKVYRQALRDLPANTTDPENPVWPEAPTP